MKKDRLSNIELLRIVSMLFIVLYHFCIHAISPNSPQNPHLLKALLPILHIGVICFVLISGYWGIRASLMGFFKLYLQCAFYSFIIYLFYVLINPETFSVKDLIIALFPMQWWYVTTYFCLYIISPIINIPLQAQSTEKKLFWIILLGIISFGFGTLNLLPSLNDGKNVINFVFIYYIGNFLHYNVKHDLKIHTKQLFIIYLLFNTFIFLSIILTANYPKIQSIINHFSFPYNSLGLIVNAVLLFLIFSTLEFKSKFVNWLSISVLPIYLIHENKYVGKYLYGFITYLHNSNYINIALLSLVLILLAIIVCFICMLIDKIFTPILQMIELYIFQSNLFKKFEKQIKLLLEKD